jgi:hypothetical protein
MHLKMYVKDIGSWASMVILQNYQNVTEMTSNMIYIVAFGGGLKYPRKINLNTQWGGADYAHHLGLHSFLGRCCSSMGIICPLFGIKLLNLPKYG